MIVYLTQMKCCIAMHYGMVYTVCFKTKNDGKELIRQNKNNIIRKCNL